MIINIGKFRIMFYKDFRISKFDGTKNRCIAGSYNCWVDIGWVNIAWKGIVQ